MTLDTFFKKFDQFADAPNAVAKMRELVLDLAATGRLIPDVLERPVDKETKLMGSVVELVMGQAPAGDEYNTEGRGTVFVKVGEFGLLYPRKEVWTNKPLKFAKKGDVLICVVGATVGKLNLAFDCAIGRSAAAIRPTSALDTKFLYYSLIPYTLRLRRNSRGSAQGVIGKAELNAILLWVPTRAVQKRIVAKVDELMALCDRLEAQQHARDAQSSALARASLARFAEAPTPANLNLLFHKSYSIPPGELRKAILAMAVRGKLLPQNPKDEPASKLLKRIDLLKREAATARRTRSTENGDSPLRTSAPFEIPSTWIWTELSNLGHTSTGKTPPTGNSEFFSGNIPFVGPGQIRPSGEMIEAGKFISELGISSSTEAKPGDILMVCIGGSIGKAAIVRERLAFNQQLNLISPIEIETGYLFSVLNAEYFYDRVISSSSGSATPIINRSKWDSILVPIPPLAEQRRIVAKVGQLMALVDQLETQLAASRATGKKLLEALVVELTNSNQS